MINKLPILTIVVPAYNEEDALPFTAESLMSLISDMIRLNLISDKSYVLFIDDGSSDNTWGTIAELYDKNLCIRGIKLSKNCGHQSALIAGYLNATGDLIVSIDADLQDDIHVIPEMINYAKSGAQIVFGVRSDRTADSAFKRLTAQAYYKFLHYLGVDIIYNHADYRLLTRKAIQALSEYNEFNIFLRGIVANIGFKTAIVYYSRAERVAGVTKYPISRMFSLAIEGATSFSVRPLRLIALIGFFISIFSFILGLWALTASIFNKETVPGWASTVIPIYLLFGFQTILLGIIGEYVGKIYVESKHRPRFFVDEFLMDHDYTKFPTKKLANITNRRFGPKE